jgi:formamidopyrimidine-DNA glycosylase
MPELPEVETLCRQLQQVITGRTIRDLALHDLRLGRIESVAGKKILTVARRGKGLEIILTGGQSLGLHLRMTGRLLLQNRRLPPLPHTRFTLSFKEDQLICIDPRRFATLALRDASTGNTPPVPDPLHGMETDCLCEIAGKRRLPVKAFLMDQRVIAGIGNIYACEILHRAAINPLREACSLSPDDWRDVAKATAAVLSKAVECRGTSISDWRDLFGQPGAFQHELAVYDREGHPCPRCGEIIVRRRLSGRGTWFCPSCQR